MSNSFFHGIMFHQFHDNKYFKKIPGSLSENHLIKIIKSYKVKNILTPEKLIEKINNNTVQNSDVCLTFDDALQSQIKIALPVLKKFNLKAFFFVQTSIFDSNNYMIEDFKIFRNRKFKNFTSFHKFFLSILLKNNHIKNKLETFFSSRKKIIKDIKKKYSFYSFIEIKHRLIRDYFLSKTDYKKILLKMCKKKKYDIKMHSKKTYFKKKDIRKLIKDGHYIGLHTHNHPMDITKLNYEEQKKELWLNYKLLKKITKKVPCCASHPSGKYDINSLKILKNLNIKLAFKDNMITSSVKKNSFLNLEIPRANSSELIFRKK